MNNLGYFQVGGTLDSDDSSYVFRQADKELLSCLEKGDFCFVLNCRQMGKSSLMIKTAAQLTENNINCAFSDLSGLGTYDVNPDKWYKSFAYQLLESLDLDEIDLDEWWKNHCSFTGINCLEKLLENVILANLSTKVVIFIDEIDSVIKLPFKDDFFAFIRGCYNKRRLNEQYKRLTFCLLGVATPPDLIEDKVRTPFNIGYPVELTGFTFEEAKDALIPGFPPFIENPQAVLKQVLFWTGGQPFLTQKLCNLIVEHSTDATSDVEQILRNYMINDWESQDYPQHFRTIRDRLLFDSHNTLRILEIAQEILQEKPVIADDSPAQNQLRLSGLVVKKERHLQIYNPIYEQIFDLSWIQEQLDNLRPYSIQLNQWLASGRSSQYLLNKHDLSQAGQWAENKSLTRNDYDYLSASREEKNQQELSKIKQEKNKIVRRGKKFLAAIIVGASLIIIGTSLIAAKKNREAKVANLSKNLSVASQDFNKGQEIRGLIRAITSIEPFQKLFQKQQTIDKYPTTEPISILNNIINQIREKNLKQISASTITNLIYSPDSKTLLTGDEAGIVRLWNLKNNQETNWTTLQKQGKITGIVVSPDGEKVYLANQEEKAGLRVLNKNGELENIFKTNRGVSSLSISPDGKIIVTGDKSGYLSLWTKEGNLIKSWSAHKFKINSIVIDTTRNIIATSGSDPTVKLWTIEGNLIASLTGNGNGHNNSVNSIAISPDGQTIATASSDTNVKLWNIDGILQRTLSGHGKSVNSVAFSPDGNRIVTASSDQTLKLWDITGVLQQTIRGHESNISHVAFSPDGQTFTSADMNGTIKVWQSPSPFTKRIEAGIFLPNQQELLSISPRENTIQSFDGNIRQELPKADNKFINTVAIAPDNHTLIAGTEDGIIAQLNLQKPEAWQLFQQDRYQGRIIAIDIHPSENSFVTLGAEQIGEEQLYTLKHWHKDVTLIKTFENNKRQEITAIKYNPQGDKIAISTRQGNIELWDIDGSSRKIIVNREQTTNVLENIVSLSFSPDGKLIATANRDGEIQLRKIDGTLLTIFNKNNNRKIVNLDFTPDGQTILALDQYGIVTYWDLDINVLRQKGCNWLQDYLVTKEQLINNICSKEKT